MTAPTVYFAPHTRAWRIFWVMEELGRPYEAKAVAFPPSKKEPDFLKINAAGSLPAFVDGDVFLTESMAICEHVATGTPLMVASGDSDRTEFLQWLWFGESSLMSPVGSLVRFAREQKDDTIARLQGGARQTLALKLSLLEQRLAGREFTGADRLTLADVSCAYPLYLLHLLGETAHIGENTAAWYARLSERSAFKTAIALR